MRRLPFYFRLPVALAAYAFAAMIRLYDFSERRREQKRRRRMLRYRGAL